MKGIRYLGTWGDYSGYGEANRMDITALHNVNVDVTTELIRQVPEDTDFGWTGALCDNLRDRNIPYKIKIIHLTPDMYPRYMEKGVYHIGRLFWETDKLPKDWIEPCNKMGEIWASSEAMAELFRSSGIKVPIYWFPQAIDTMMGDKAYDKYIIEGHRGFLFYSIFQWIERKNPKGLITSYWKTFSGRDDVSLLIKTYGVNYTAEENEKIIREIESWRKQVRLPHYPRLLIQTKLLTRRELMKLHLTGDCYVTADHGEGWARPLQEALLMGKPVISTSRGGIHEYLTEEMYFPIPSEYVPVIEQPNIKFYTSDQNWAEPNYEKLETAMRWVYDNREVASTKGIKAKNFIKDEFNFYNVGLQMRKRLEDIDKRL